MSKRAPAEIGMNVVDVDTPALLIDLAALERNLKKLADVTAKSKLKLRPHGKSHKSPVIAHMQMALGAVGVCCQKVSEAEAMVEGGVPDIYISNQVADPRKLARLAALAHRARIATCVDHPNVIKALAKAAQDYGVEIRTLVEIDVGQKRCGVEPGPAVVPLAQAIEKAKGLRFDGLQAYYGTAQHFRGFTERRDAIRGAADKVNASRDALKAAGIACPTVTGGGTGTYPFEIASGVYTELQAGSYAFMDGDYGKNRSEDGGDFRDFEQSLFVLAQVMSTPTADRFITDAGTKSLSVDSGPPSLSGVTGCDYAMGGDEHGKILLKEGSNVSFKLGQKVRVVPSHCDTTVGLHDWYVGFRGDRVEAVWPIAGRGAIT